MAKTIGVLLSGCGVNDGSEIHEATLTLLFLDQAGVTIHFIAPDAAQSEVINHQNDSPSGEERNILVESARIARGGVHPVTDVKVGELDGLILPGGFGAAKNLSNYAFKGRDCTLRPEVKNLILGMRAAGKPLGFICIAPVLAAVAFKEEARKPLLTIGTDTGTAADIEYFGARHQTASVDQIVVDEEMKIVSTPAYMLGPAISDIAPGIEKLVNKVVGWC